MPVQNYEKPLSSKISIRNSFNVTCTGHLWWKNNQTNILSRVTLLMWQSWTNPLFLEVGSKFHYKIKRGGAVNTDKSDTFLWRCINFAFSTFIVPIVYIKWYSAKSERWPVCQYPQWLICHMSIIGYLKLLWACIPIRWCCKRSICIP